MAEEFGAIMKALWSGQFKYISPRDFKVTIGKINEQFSGYEQQDSQELLLFLMDGLHEDLNKVTAAHELLLLYLTILMHGPVCPVGSTKSRLDPVHQLIIQYIPVHEAD